MDYHFEDFTESNYRRLIKLAKQNYVFIAYDQYRSDFTEKVVLWRHDIDFSPHRALKLATIEAEEGVKATYFVHLNSSYYNVFEPSVHEKLKQIQALGHDIGIHFDCEFNHVGAEKEKFESGLLQYKKIFEILFEAVPTVFSFHNPTESILKTYIEDQYAEMINTYNAYLKNSYKYCSDSNGYWRFDRLEDVIAGGYDKLQVLTHPGWWQETVMAPRERMQRCIDGRKHFVERSYDSALQENSRGNIGLDLINKTVKTYEQK